MSDRLEQIWCGVDASEGFAGRVMARWDAESSRRRRRSRRWRSSLVALVAGVAMAIAISTLSSSARLVASDDTDGIDAEVTRVEQSAGVASYRLEAHQRIEVNTPDGVLAATGAHFSVEVVEMKREIISAVGGAAIAATVVVIYQGTVTARSEDDIITASSGQRVTLGGGRGRSSSSSAVETLALAPSAATRAELVIRDRLQVRRINELQTRVSELEARLASPSASDVEASREPPDEKFLDLSEDELAVLADRCEVRYDIPLYAMTNAPSQLFDSMFSRSEVSAVERELIEKAITASDPVLLETMREIYIEVTGDRAGAETLSPRNMQHEVFDKSLQVDISRAVQAVSAERAGRSEPPVDLASRPPVERLIRALAASGARLEASLGADLGAERAHALREAGLGWARRKQAGCPEE